MGGRDWYGRGRHLSLHVLAEQRMLRGPSRSNRMRGTVTRSWCACATGLFLELVCFGYHNLYKGYTNTDRAAETNCIRICSHWSERPRNPFPVFLTMTRDR